MPGTNRPQDHLAHRILTTAHTLLHTDGKEEFTRLSDLLARAAEHLPADDRTTPGPRDIAWAEAEAAGHLAACVHFPLTPGSPSLEHCLQILDQLPRTARLGLLAAAARRTAPHPSKRQAPLPRIPAQRRAARPCPCPCNSGGFCGGCGHAGCGGRR